VHIVVFDYITAIVSVASLSLSALHVLHYNYQGVCIICYHLKNPKLASWLAKEINGGVGGRKLQLRVIMVCRQLRSHIVHVLSVREMQNGGHFQVAAMHSTCLTHVVVGQ
jgi:hypothetical protein